ncbi:MAG TPA: hypothetical protein ENK57_23975 [Polyangiaceae bacterium]|nr:hypothetical protein [Polyangiaceae bacterium]
MSRTLTLYELDRPALKTLTAELEAALENDDRDGLAKLLELGDTMRSALDERERLVDFFLLPETHVAASALFASLRRISKKRALTPVMTSSDLALEGRLRNFEVLREQRTLAELVDKLLSSKRLPWYLRRPGATGGWLDPDQRATLARGMGELAPALTPELREMQEGLDEAEGDVVLHDGL